MTHRIPIDKRIAFIVLAVAGCLLLCHPPQATAADYVVVINKNLGIDNISSSDLEAIFTGKKKFWDSGEKVALAIFSDEAAQSTFFRQHVHKTPSQYKNFWTKMVFTGKASMPDYLKTPEQVLAFVSSTPGAISFVPAPGGANVKVLNIQ